MSSERKIQWNFVAVALQRLCHRWSSAAVEDEQAKRDISTIFAIAPSMRKIEEFHLPENASKTSSDNEIKIDHLT